MVVPFKMAYILDDDGGGKGNGNVIVMAMVVLNV